jgi:hypothetical protein
LTRSPSISKTKAQAGCYRRIPNFHPEENDENNYSLFENDAALKFASSAAIRTFSAGKNSGGLLAPGTST